MGVAISLFQFSDALSVFAGVLGVEMKTLPVNYVADLQSTHRL